MTPPREPPPSDSAVPTLADVLTWCEASGPAGWFPADRAADGPVRELLYQHTMDLRRLGYIEVADWVRGKGQGFVLTDAGRLKRGRPVTAPPAPARPVLTTADGGVRDRADLIDPRPAVVAPALVVACLTWFAIGLYLAITAGTTTTYLASADVPTLTRIGAAYGPNLYAGEWWRLGVSGFVHIGVLHLLLNGYGLYLSGSTAEALWGRWRFAIIFGVSVVAGSALATALRPASLLAGASGGIWGVLLSIVAWIVLHRRQLEAEWIRDASGRIGFAVFVNALASAVPGVSWEAHLGGGVVGFFTACLLRSVRPGAGWGGRIAVGTLALALLTAGLAYRKIVTTSGRWEPIRRQAGIPAANANGVTARVAELNAKSAVIPWERVQSLHTTGSVAVASGSAKQAAVVRERAGQLRADAAALASEFESLDAESFPADQRDRYAKHFRTVAAFASSVLEALDDPNPARAWPRTREPMRLVTESFRDTAREPGR